MALNITFTGKIYNQLGDLADAKVKVYHYNSGTWSGEYTTVLNEYSSNAGDGTFLTQDGSVSVGDVFLIKAYGTDGIAIVKITHTGADMYSQSIQLQPIKMPTGTLTVPSTSTINHSITVSSTSSNEYQWVAYGATHYHKSFWYGTSLFTDVGILSVEYDFGSGYATAVTHTYTSIGNYTVYCKIKSITGGELILSKPIKIAYNAPIGGTIINPTSPILNDAVIVTADITDVDNRVTSIAYNFDSVLEAVNNNKIFSYSKVLDTFKSYSVTQNISYNDGFTDRVVNFSYNIILTNQIPSCSFTYVQSGKDFTFYPTASDVDGTIDHLLWEIGYQMPFDNDFTVVYTTSSGIEDKMFSFPSSGLYRVTLSAFDNLGAYGTYSMDIEQTANGDTIYLGHDIVIKELPTEIYLTQSSINIKTEFEEIKIVTSTISEDINAIIQNRDINISEG